MLPSLIKRRKTHFHNLPCGASIILGNNGYIWISPMSNEELELDNPLLAGGFVQDLKVILKVPQPEQVAEECLDQLKRQGTLS